MIQSGGWSNLRAPDEHTKLARIALSFEPALDEAFKINVAKMRVQIPAIIREEVKEVIQLVTRLAREIYDGKPRKPTVGPVRSSTPSAGTGSSGFLRGLATSPGVASQQVSAEVLTFDEWTDRVLRTATPQERVVIDAVVSRLRLALSSRRP